MKGTTPLILFRKNRFRTIVGAIKGNTISQIFNPVKVKIEDSIYIHKIINIVSYKSRHKDLETTDILSFVIHQEINLIAAFKIEENQALYLEDREDYIIIIVAVLTSPSVHFAGREDIQKISAAKSKSVSIVPDLDTQY